MKKEIIISGLIGLAVGYGAFIVYSKYKEKKLNASGDLELIELDKAWSADGEKLSDISGQKMGGKAGRWEY